MSTTDHLQHTIDPPPAAGVRVQLLGGRGHGEYRRMWGWAVSPGVVADTGDRETALSGFLDELRERRLRPLFTDLRDPRPFARRGLDTHHYADSAVLDIAASGPATTPAPDLHAEMAAAGALLTVLPFHPLHHDVADALASCAPDQPAVHTFVAVDAAGALQGVAVWSRPADGADDVRVLHLATSPSTAPTTTVGLLIADAAERFRVDGVRHLELDRRPRWPWWPRPLSATPHDGHTASVARFGLRWEPRWLAVPSRWQLPAAAAVLRRITD